MYLFCEFLLIFSAMLQFGLCLKCFTFGISLNKEVIKQELECPENPGQNHTASILNLGDLNDEIPKAVYCMRIEGFDTEDGFYILDLGCIYYTPPSLSKEIVCKGISQTYTSLDISECTLCNTDFCNSASAPAVGFLLLVSVVAATTFTC